MSASSAAPEPATAGPMAQAHEPISWWQTFLGEPEAEAVAAAVRNRHISFGPLTARLESRLAGFLGVRHAVVTPSGSTALLLSMIALGVGPGDEVIVPDITWIASAHCASLLGARIVLADCLPDRPLIDPEQVARLITPRTKAIVPVHLGGRRAAVETLRDLARPHGIAVVEDAAQAFASRHAGGWLGTDGDIGVYSLGLAKLVATGQGGFAVTDDDTLAERLRLGRVHGVKDMPAETYLQPGFNLKFSDILAALGLAQMDRIEQKMAHVRAVYDRYAAGLADHEHVRIVPCDLAAGELPLWTEIRCAARDSLIEHLTAHAIQSRPVHRPLHAARHLTADGRDADFPNATRLAAELLILPSGPAQPLANVDRTIEVLRSFDGQWRQPPMQSTGNSSR